MTNYGRDPLEELWKEILEIHWKYLESEENMDKIEERRLLEGRLKEYISVVTHNRKFFLPETENVLRRSVTQARDFSAFKCADGFESISHYANNLFTKPWRKEYRVIKMFSGFYQHEIKNNLMNAEELFIAMGYKLLPNNTLVLEGPICPDQVTNVSRDALTAYVECQIMKQINADLASMGLTTTWQEIYSFRERHVGDSSQSIKGLAQLIQSRHNHVMRKDSYACSVPVNLLAHQIVPPSSSSHYQQPSHLHNNQNMCGSHCNIHPSSYTPSPIHNQIPPPPLPPSTSSYYNPSSYNQPCSLHANYVPPPPPAPGSSYYQQSQQNLPHSKSLDQYDGAKQIHANGNIHRLSLDQSYKLNHPMHSSPVATGQFDCIDTVAFNHHPYNQPNVRSPLPYNLSNNPLGQAQSQQTYYPPDWGYYHQLHQHQQSLPTPVSDYKSYTDFTDSSSPAMPESELISFNDAPQSNRSENKLRSSLKKSLQEQEHEHELELLRSLKKRDRERDHTSYSESSSRTHDEIMAELDSLRITTSNGHGPPKGYASKSNGTLPNASNAPQTSSAAVQNPKMRTKSVSTTTESSNHHHEHKRTSSVMETSSSRSNSDKYKPPQQPQIIVPAGEWSCRFCTFLNPDAKRICDMCSKSKDFFNDADKSSSAATATCV